MKIAELKKIILKNLDKLEENSYRGRVNSLKLWMEFGLTRKKRENFEKLYRQHQSALELLIKNDEVENVDKKHLSDCELQLTAKGREKLDEINKNFIWKIYYYFEPQIKSETFKLLIWVFTLVIAYMTGYYKIFIEK